MPTAYRKYHVIVNCDSLSNESRDSDLCHEVVK